VNASSAISFARRRASHGAVEYFPVSTEMELPRRRTPKRSRRCSDAVGSSSAQLTLCEDPATADLHAAGGLKDRGDGRHERRETCAHGIDETRRRSSVERPARHRRHVLAVNQQARRVPRHVEVAAIVVLDVAEWPRADEHAREAHGTSGLDAERHAVPMRPRCLWLEPDGPIDFRSPLPQSIPISDMNLPPTTPADKGLPLAGDRQTGAIALLGRR